MYNNIRNQEFHQTIHVMSQRRKKKEERRKKKEERRKKKQERRKKKEETREMRVHLDVMMYI